ncbi:MAG: hypothetical protein KAR42_06475 [candidate division Zixibacteria bacterium]|nr:hypothetical protein [candidate division Zixibacteria bacterium]
MKGKTANVLWMTCLILIVSSSIAFGQTPANTILYQGKLTDDAGPITTEVVVTFTIWSALTGGTSLYDVELTFTPDENGLFTVELGPVGPDVLDGNKKYLGITVGGDSEMTPRQVLTSSPAAHTAFTSPGVVYNSHEPGNQWIGLIDSVVSYDSVIVVAPGPGYIHVFATTSLRVNHTNGTTDDFQMQVSPMHNEINWGTFGFNYIRMPSTAATGQYVNSCAVQRVFPVSSGGVYKYYTNMNMRVGYDAADDFLDLDMTAIYYPKSYGNVDNVGGFKISTGSDASAEELVQ